MPGVFIIEYREMVSCVYCCFSWHRQHLLDDKFPLSALEFSIVSIPSAGKWFDKDFNQNQKGNSREILDQFKSIEMSEVE